MREEYNSILSTPLLRPIILAVLADIDMSVKPKYQPDIFDLPLVQCSKVL